MSIEGREIKVGKTVYTLEELSIDRTLRLTDIIFRVLDKLSDDVQKEFADYVDNYRENNDIVITKALLVEEEVKAKEIEAELGDDAPDPSQLRPLHTAVINEGLDPSQLQRPLTIAANPAEEEVVGFFLPKVYAVARPELLTLFALVLAENAKMAEAEDQEGGVDAYLNSIAVKVKHEGKTADLVKLILVAWEVGKDEFDRIKSAGNLPAPLQGLLGDTPLSQSEEQTPSI